MVAGGVLAMSWNGLSFTAAAELAGRARSGASLGLQQTALAVGGATLPARFRRPRRPLAGLGMGVLGDRPG